MTTDTAIGNTVSLNYNSYISSCGMHAVGEGNTSNPLKQVLNAIGEKVECATYDRVSLALFVLHLLPLIRHTSDNKWHHQ